MRDVSELVNKQKGEKGKKHADEGLEALRQHDWELMNTFRTQPKKRNWPKPVRGRWYN